MSTDTYYGCVCGALSAQEHLDYIREGDAPMHIYRAAVREC